jgi:hypothetical protein
MLKYTWSYQNEAHTFPNTSCFLTTIRIGDPTPKVKHGKRGEQSQTDINKKTAKQPIHPLLLGGMGAVLIDYLKRCVQ